jgi:large subunit ribosomal protein L4e
MKAKVFDLQGSPVKEISLPAVFHEAPRPDLWTRVLIALRQNRRQRYGANIWAGLRSSAHYHGLRRYRYSMMNKEMARLPRTHGRGMPMIARKVPMAVKGRYTHPPMVERNFEQKVNQKENRVAIRSAIAATAVPELVSQRHATVGKHLPYILTNDLQKIKKASDVEAVLEKLGFAPEIERCKEKTIRSSRGKMRGRRYRKKVGLLIVVEKDEGIARSARNLAGVDVVRVQDLNVEAIAPGAIPRLTLWTEGAIEALGSAPKEEKKEKRVAVKAK